MTEVIKIIGEDEINNKKLKIYAYYSYDEIGQMHNLLPDEQKAKLGPYIEDFKKIVSKLQDDNYVAGHRHVLNKALKHYYNEVSKNFSYIKMKNYLQG